MQRTKKDETKLEAGLNATLELQCLSISCTAETTAFQATFLISLTYLYQLQDRVWENQQHACYCTFRRAKFDPDAEMMWLKTSLVFRNGQGWDSEPVSELEKMEGDIYDFGSDFGSFDTCSCPLRAQRGLWLCVVLRFDAWCVLAGAWALLRSRCGLGAPAACCASPTTWFQNY